MADQSRLRLRRVRFKDGRTIEVLRQPSAEDDARGVVKRVKQMLDAHAGRVAGFAVVVWAPDNGSTAQIVVTDASTIPTILVPDFVRNRLLAEQIEAWTLKTISDQD